MKIFLTGGTGYIGGNFLNYAINKGHTVYALSRKKNNKKRKKLNLASRIIKKNGMNLKNVTF